MRLSLKADDVRTVLQQAVTDVEISVTDAMNEVTSGLKADLREQVTGAGLGQRLARTWRGKRFPENHPSMNAAAYVWSKAPDIIDGFDRGPTIRTVHGGKYLVIPTTNVPKRRRGQSGRGSHM
jgi:hypothetical protein